MLSVPISSLTPNHSASADVEKELTRLLVLDDPQEWGAFTRPYDQENQDTHELMESQVVVRGMYCAACSLTLEQSLLGVKGVRSVHVSAASGRASIIWNAADTRPSLWMRAPLALGYSLLPASDAFREDAGRQEARLMLWRWLVAGFCMMQVMMYAAPGYFSVPGDITPDIEKLLRWASWLLSLPVLLFSCNPFFRNALRDLRHRRISMDLPVSLGIAVTFAVSTAATFEPQGWWGTEVYFDSLTMFVFFLLSGRWLEQRLRARTAGSLDLLSQRLPDSVERMDPDGKFDRIAVRRLRAGDVIRVLPGEAFPVDGTILVGNTFADEAILTGESTAVARPVGAAVLAGSYNLSSAVQIRVDKLGAATFYSQIVALMAKAAVEKPRLALLADRVARPFLWLVLVAAAGAAVFWWNTNPAMAIMAAVAVLVVTCPCALSLATPAAMLSSAGLLARHGVLVRRLQSLEALASIDTVIFDKTGTLTEAAMGLRETWTRSGLTASDALHLAAGVAACSLHPVSRALVEAALVVEPSAVCDVKDVREYAGQGVEGTVQPTHKWGERLRLGSAAFCGVEAQGSSGLQVYLSDERGWLARFEFREMPRADAAQSVAALQAQGIDVHLLSGDRPQAVLRMGNQLLIHHMEGGCTPSTKLARLQQLQQQGRKVLMVGDGLNDGPVLAGADVSVALGMTVPMAQAQSDLVIPGGQLRMLPLMLNHARFTMRVVRQNLCWAAAYNAVCVPMAIAGWLPAWLAGLGMALSSLLVVANAARLARFKPARN
ncbi:MAG: cation-translocating P-type ATPase [Pseudomonadota bacterium]